MAGKHTAGPWILEMNSVHSGGIATVHHCTGGWAEIWSDKWIESGMGPEVMDANARLIAAAPDLLNALTVLANAAESLGIPVDAARAAIARATQPLPPPNEE